MLEKVDREEGLALQPIGCLAIEVAKHARWPVELKKERKTLKPMCLQKFMFLSLS